VASSAQAVLAPIPLLPRLETHYFENMYQDLMILTYQHTKSVKDLETEREWQLDSQSLDERVQANFKTHLHLLETEPETKEITGILSLKEKQEKAIKKKKLKNLIDYTSIPKEIFNAPEWTDTSRPYSPLMSRIPALKSVVLDIYTEEAIQNKSILLSAIMSLQSISGVRPDPVLATKGDASRKIRAGMAIGARVELKDQDAFHFLDKTIQCVLPRIREWEGVNPEGDNQGAISFKLPASSIGTFPDIEAHFDSFPRLFDVTVTINTTGQDDWESVLLLSGFQLPFLKEKKVVEQSVFVSDDPFAKIKQAKTREERKILFAQMTEERRKQQKKKDEEYE